MDNLKSLTKLKNRYFILRHGQSLANVQGIIVSKPEKAVSNFGLSEKGKEDVKNSVLKNTILNSDTIIYSSDFLRAKETAEIAQSILKAKPVILDKRLRERFFCNYDGMSHNYYNEIWASDKTQSDKIDKGIESVNSVLQRVSQFILDLENKFNNKTILIVSHGDVLQILLAGFLSLSPSNHREIPHLNTAEIRKLVLSKSIEKQKL